MFTIPYTQIRKTNTKAFRRTQKQSYMPMPTKCSRPCNLTIHPRQTQQSGQNCAHTHTHTYALIYISKVINVLIEVLT